MKIDWTEVNDGPFGQAGVYRVRVERAELKIGKKSNLPYFDLTFLALDFSDKFLCYDVISVSGDGRRLGQGKLRSLGFTDEDKEIEASQFRDRRCYVWIVKEMGQNGKWRRKVDVIWDKGFEAGYAPMHLPIDPEWPMVLPDLSKPTAGRSNDDVPQEVPF